MNFRNVKAGPWSALSLTCYVSAVTLGLYGKSRINYSSDFTYNKYHFGVCSLLASGAGFMLSCKVTPSWHPGVFFLGGIANLVVPSILEGF